jgi:hypothetical protein
VAEDYVGVGRIKCAWMMFSGDVIEKNSSQDRVSILGHEHRQFELGQGLLVTCRWNLVAVSVVSLVQYICLFCHQAVNAGSGSQWCCAVVVLLER